MGKITYKIILIIMCSTGTLSSFAKEMCVPDDNVTIILDANIAPTWLF